MLVYNERKYQKAVGKEIFIWFGGKIINDVIITKNYWFINCSINVQFVSLMSVQFKINSLAEEIIRVFFDK